MSEIKRPRRSERISDLKVLKKEREWNVFETVVHSKYLWMEIGKWSLPVFRALSKITRSDQSDTLAFQRQLVKDLLIVQRGGECMNVNSGGAAYLVYYIDENGEKALFNPFGPIRYHMCTQTKMMAFETVQYSGTCYADTPLQWTVRRSQWFDLYMHLSNSSEWKDAEKEDLEFIGKAIVAYRDNPFAIIIN